MRSRWLFLLPVLTTLLLTPSCSISPSSSSPSPSSTRKYDSETDMIFRFHGDSTETFLEYHHPRYGHIRQPVPTFMKDFSGRRLAMEVNFYFEAGGRWSDRVVLEIFYYAVTFGLDYNPDPELDRYSRGWANAHNWLDDTVNVCDWAEIVCGDTEPKNPGKMEIILGMNWRQKIPSNRENKKPPNGTITQIILKDRMYQGTLPTELALLEHLHRLDLYNNRLKGTIPTEFGAFSSLTYLDLGNNDLTGTIPWTLGQLRDLEGLWLEQNKLEGAIHYGISELSACLMLDLSHNQLSGTIPPEIESMKSLLGLYLEHNQLTGTVLKEFSKAGRLLILELGSNKLTGTIPTELGEISLQWLHLFNNRLSGTVPTEVFQRNLTSVQLASNRFTGTIPAGDDMGGDSGFKWSTLASLSFLTLENNALSGTIPPAFLKGVGDNILSLHLGFNELTGTLPTEVGLLSKVQGFYLPYNKIHGTVPSETQRMTHLREINLTANLFTGVVPEPLCHGGSPFRREFGCDAILCPAGKFQPTGAASGWGACRECRPDDSEADAKEPSLNKVLGRTSCSGVKFKVGDANGDGKVTLREVLRLIFVQTHGFFWGKLFQNWFDMKVHECDLKGVTCKNGKIVKLDLDGAVVCGGVPHGKDRTKEPCYGLPGEIGLLSDLEVLLISEKQYLQGTIPSTIGKLTNLHFLDISQNHRLQGSIPTEIGKLTKLKALNLSQCGLRGGIPTQIGLLTDLETVNLSVNSLGGPLPSEIGRLIRVREFMVSRLMLNGTIPTTFGMMATLENSEIYGNLLTGTIPSEIGKCSSLKRLDAFNNKLTGTIPPSLSQIASLQIIHLKRNRLTGTLPPELGSLEYLSWLDVTSNTLSGTIPSSYGSARSLRDLRLGANRLTQPIPHSLCSNTRINMGLTKLFGCDAILCPLGSVADGGFAREPDGCVPCEFKGTTIYLGSTHCVQLYDGDILSMLFDVMHGERWHDDYDRRGWVKPDLPVCEWPGVVCGEDGTIISISLPVSESETVQNAVPPLL